MNVDTSAEDRLRSALADAAETVHEAPDAYRRAQRHWQRLELRRRAVMVSLVLVLVILACAAGIWALSGASPAEHVVFDDRGHGRGVLRLAPGAL
ncbi:hypothetical protein [Streptomyces sp. NPDC058308]|uniref:hypothetical protein n=1 Tax=Streptomyces sp. NPDC058308 TaxID=3346440 RepID=UPI0036F04025